MYSIDNYKIVGYIELIIVDVFLWKERIFLIWVVKLRIWDWKEKYIIGVF